MNQTVKAAGGFLLDEVRKAAVRLALWLALAVVVFVATPWWSQVAAVWRSAQTLEQVRAEIHRLAEGLDALRGDVVRLAGEDRVIRQTPGLSYVAEPVRQGEPVTLYLVAQRTRLGAQCRLLTAVPLFTDSTGITVAGTVAPVGRQIGSEATRLRVGIDAPPSLRPGRIELHLALDYDCGGVRTPDRTDTVVFTLLERERG